MKLNVSVLVFCAVLMLSGCTQQSESENDAGDAANQQIVGDALTIEQETPMVISDELDALTRAYLTPAIYAGATSINWGEPGQIEARAFLNMYAMTNVWNREYTEDEMEQIDEVWYYFVPAEEVETYITGYFEIPPDYLRGSLWGEQYNEEREAYAFNMMGVGWAYYPHVLAAQQEEDLLILTVSVSDDDWNPHSILTVRLMEDGSFRYLSNELLTPAPLPEAEGPVPEFLDAEQQRLYRQAKTAYMQFDLTTDGFNSLAKEPMVEVGGTYYFRSNGAITKWADFEAAMLSVFTPEYYEALQTRNSYTGQDGTYRAQAPFVEVDGHLYYSGGGRGGNVLFLGDETFELVSRTDDEIHFNVVGSYEDSYLLGEDGEIIRDAEGRATFAGEPTQERFPLTMVRGEDGWRFCEFNLAF